MTTLVRRLAAFLVIAGLFAGAAAARADEPTSAEVIDPATCSAAWKTLFDTVGAQGAVLAAFTERRWFSVRKEPVVLEGELRHSPERGLSLRYTKPEERMMIVDTQGILLRNAAGRSRSLKSDPRAPQVDTMLLHILRFDVAALNRLFEIRGSRDADKWTLVLTPRTADLARSVGGLVVEGEGTAVRRLEFSRGEKQRVEVTMGETHTGVTFSAEELSRFFR